LFIPFSAGITVRFDNAPAVRFQQESVSVFDRKCCPFSAGIGVRFAQELVSGFSNAFTKPSPPKAAILQIRFIPLTEDSVMAINTWFTPNFVALCHWVGNEELMDFTIF
jgi:hypothetical protein